MRNHSVAAVSILDVGQQRAMESADWAFSTSGSISYVPVGENELFDWREISHERMDSVIDILRETFERGEPAGLAVMAPRSETGGNLLIWSPTKASLSLMTNRRRLPDGSDVTDFSWYLARLLPVLRSLAIPVLKISCEDVGPRCLLTRCSRAEAPITYFRLNRFRVPGPLFYK